MRILPLLFLLLLFLLLLRAILFVSMFLKVNQLSAQPVLRQPRLVVRPQAAIEQPERNFNVA
jgi:hypothetical protein